MANRQFLLRVFLFYENLRFHRIVTFITPQNLLSMTYRDKIQAMKKTIDSIYDDAEWLRDIATVEEKYQWNKLRGIFYDAGRPLSDLDNSLSDARAKMEID